jgi:sucrose-6-phosphate hydrolase SacC (GH32 family)
MAVSNNNNPGSWTRLNSNRPVLTSNVGTRGVRDPSLIRSPDGSKFWIIATDLWVYPRGWNVGDDYTTKGSHGIVVWESSDLKNWSSAALRIVSPSNAGMTWAPDAIWDPATNRCGYSPASRAFGSLFVYVVLI